MGSNLSNCASVHRQVTQKRFCSFYSPYITSLVLLGKIKEQSNNVYCNLPKDEPRLQKVVVNNCKFYELACFTKHPSISITSTNLSCVIVRRLSHRASTVLGRRNSVDSCMYRRGSSQREMKERDTHRNQQARLGSRKAFPWTQECRSPTARTLACSCHCHQSSEGNFHLRE